MCQGCTNIQRFNLIACFVSQQQSWPQVIPDVSLGHSIPTESPQFYSIVPPQRKGERHTSAIYTQVYYHFSYFIKSKIRIISISSGRKKLRLYEYLHEALNDTNMGDSIQWTDSSSGTFHFISKNKEKLAECWGQRKGNRKTMTYQKMARALRNYSRTGEIIKVRRKLTYQFNPDILHKLGSAQGPPRLPCHPAQEEAHSQQQPSPGEQSLLQPLGGGLAQLVQPLPAAGGLRSGRQLHLTQHNQTLRRRRRMLYLNKS